MLSLKIWDFKQAIFISYERAAKLAISKCISHRNFWMENLHMYRRTVAFVLTNFAENWAG